MQGAIILETKSEAILQINKVADGNKDSIKCGAINPALNFPNPAPLALLQRALKLENQ
jgi:hypothetical protein